MTEQQEDLITDLHCALFHMDDDEAKIKIDEYLEKFPELLELHDREWYYRNC